MPSLNDFVPTTPSKNKELNCPLLFSAFVICFGCPFLFGYNIGVLNQPAILIKEFFNTTYTERYSVPVSHSMITLTWSLTTALFIPGGILGAFLGGWLADLVGRKRTIMISFLFLFIGAILSSLCVVAKAPELLMIGRVFLGVDAGMAICLAPMFLSEIVPMKYRGAFGTMNQLFITIGILSASIFGIKEIFGSPRLWPFIMLIEIVPAFISLCFLPFIPDPPRFLMLVKKNKTAAIKALRFYHGREDVNLELEEITSESNPLVSQKSDEDHMQSFNVQNPRVEIEGDTKFSYKDLFSSQLRKPLLIAILLQIAQQFSGINAIFFYAVSIFTNAGVNSEHIPYAIIGTNIINVLMTIITVPLMDKAGRRLLLLVPMVIMVLDFIIMTICLVLQKNENPPHGIAYVSIVCVIVYVISFAVGLGPIPMMIGSELFRQGPRPKAMTIANVTNWIGVFIVAMAFEPIHEAAEQYTFIIFIILLIIFIILVYIFVPETKNKSFEEIANQMSPSYANQVGT